VRDLLTLLPFSSATPLIPSPLNGRKMQRCNQQQIVAPAATLAHISHNVENVASRTVICRTAALALTSCS
jgi:hypothetical protein